MKLKEVRLFANKQIDCSDTLAPNGTGRVFPAGYCYKTCPVLLAASGAEHCGVKDIMYNFEAAPKQTDQKT